MQLDRALETGTDRRLDRNVVLGEYGWLRHAEDCGTVTAFDVDAKRRGSATARQVVGVGETRLIAPAA